MRRALILTLALLQSGSLAAGPTLTLSEALARARAHQPQLAEVRASIDAARAREDQAFAPLLPQASATLAYQVTTANFANRPGAMPAGVAGLAAKSSSFDLFNFWNAGLTLNQVVWDFGRTAGRWRSAGAAVEAAEASERVTAAALAQSVRLAYFDAQAARELRRVAEETLANRGRHLAQIEAFVAAGKKPEIDVVQWRVELANARVLIANARKSDGSARSRLVQAMGDDGALDFDVTAERFAPVEGEQRDVASLVDEAWQRRPETRAHEAERRAQTLTIEAIEGGYWPTLSVSTSLSEAGSQLDRLAWNWSAGVNLSWAFFEGNATRAAEREARATLAGLEARRSALRQQVRAEVEQAWLAVEASREAQVASAEAVVQARERLRLAEGRYETGVGEALELADAELAVVAAEVQEVQAALALAGARAQLLTALGRSAIDP